MTKKLTVDEWRDDLMEYELVDGYRIAALNGQGNYAMLGFMKTIIDIPDSALQQARTIATAQGISVEQLLANAVIEKLRGGFSSGNGHDRPWMKGFGGLADLKEENARIMKSIEDEFEQIEPEDRT